MKIVKAVVGATFVVFGLSTLMNAATYGSRYDQYSAAEPLIVGVIGVLLISGGIFLLINAFRNPAS
jgi:uncharacterized membrane protein HdeD (DUF308 family)